MSKRVLISQQQFGWQPGCEMPKVRKDELMPMEEDDRPRKKITHEIGQDLSLLSVEELTERMALLTSEIARLQEAAGKKRASKDAADRFFKS
jgi:uncharacterized small protein (DUF1192 family)